MNELRTWLAGKGFPVATGLTVMRRGLGSTELWSFQPGSGDTTCVVRIFPSCALAAAEREALAMQAASSHGLPVPAILARGELGDRPVLVTTFVAGIPAFEAITAQPGQAYDIGRAMGEVFGGIHRFCAPDGLDRDWIACGGPAIEPLRDVLRALPVQDRLLHLDYHPLNVLFRDGQVSGVIDWENTMAGPPHMDLGRTRAILRVRMLARLAGPIDATVVAAFERGLIEGHDTAYGPDPDPDLSLAWGLAMTVDDLSRQASKPGSPISADILGVLAAERDGLITRL